MKFVPITAEMLAPVVIKRDRQSDRSESARYVPGTALRGALASIYLQHHGQTDNRFERLFLDESKCCFGPLDPGPNGFPLTAASCKREDARHALVDLLWFRAAQHHSGERVLSREAETAWSRCSACKSDLKPQAGFWSECNGEFHRMKIDRRQVDAHVGIDRVTGTAADSIFYTLDALAPSNDKPDLYGWLRVDQDELDALQELLQSEDCRISVGHARTRGYGDIQLKMAAPVQSVAPQEHEKRWEQWSLDLNGFLSAQPLALSSIPDDAFYFALTFPTGAVLVDRFLRYTLDPADMVPMLPPMPTVAGPLQLNEGQPLKLGSGGTIRWIAGVTRHELLRGWNAAHGLPRQDEWSVARGSAYLYRFEGSLAERAAVVAQLVTLTKDGIGLRRNEGFGMVSVCDDFHCQFRYQEPVPCTS